jgi:hypothetical protein
MTIFLQRVRIDADWPVSGGKGNRSMIEQDVIAGIKGSVDLVAVIRSRGIEL